MRDIDSAKNDIIIIDFVVVYYAVFRHQFELAANARRKAAPAVEMYLFQ